MNLAWLPAVGIIYTIIIYPYLTGQALVVSNIRFWLSVAVTFFAIYFSNLLYLFFIKKPGIKSVKHAFDYGYRRLLHLLPVYTIIYVIFVGASLLTSKNAWLSGLAFILVTAWARVFVKESVK